MNTIDTTFTFRNMESTEALRIHVMDKLERVKKYLMSTADVHCILKVEGARHLAEITLNVRGGRYVGHAISNDMYTSIDGAVDRIVKQLSRIKERRKGHKGE
ncbi:MAG: ribosome-associated translation inhibitor RaiA [Pseudomonadota bacterium]